MVIFKLIAIGIVTAITVLILKSAKPELAFAATIVGSLLLLISAVDLLFDLFSFFTELADTTGIDNNIIKLLLKIVAIGYICEFSSDLLTDFGSISLANKVDLCGKITIILLAIPIIKTLIAVIYDFLNLSGV